MKNRVLLAVNFLGTSNIFAQCLNISQQENLKIKEQATAIDNIISNALIMETGATLGVKNGEQFIPEKHTLSVMMNLRNNTIKNTPNFTNSWSGVRYASEIFTFKLPDFLSPENFPLMFIASDSFAKTSWSSWSYSDLSPKQAMHHKKITDIGKNISVTNYNDVQKYANITLYNKKGYGAVSQFRTRQDIGLTYFKHNKHWYFQLLVWQYAERWGGSENGALFFNLGNSIQLVKDEQTFKFLDN